jgi:hypothetical protein
MTRRGINSTDRDDEAREAARMLHRAWTERLYREYDNVLFQYRVKLATPVLRIEERLSTWGEWNPSTRTITIARRLVETQPWDVVIEVLKHEIAHQVVSELLQKVEQHGVHFLRACDRLGVAPWARSATGKLPDEVPRWRERAVSEHDERLLKRAEKLLALAGSANEHEAALAMRRVRELYARYNLERLRERKPEDLVYAIITRKKQRFDTYESTIFAILSEHFFVKTVCTTTFDAADGVEYKAVELLGARANVLLAEYVYHYLYRTIHDLWTAHRAAGHESGGQQKRSYLLGLLKGFRDKLARERVAGETPHEAVSQADKALLAVGSREAEDFLRYRHPRLSTRRYGGAPIDGHAYAAGVQAGERITIRKGVEQHAGNRGKLLPR